jgi:hypothetical protein
VTRTLTWLVWADLLERVRRPGFLMTLASATYLAYTIHAGFWSMRHGEFRAEAGPAYTATMTALLAGTLLAWFGFYLVKNAIERDRTTGVGEILAATPLRSLAYTLGKAISNLLVLATMVGVLVVAVAWMSLRSATVIDFGLLEVVLTFLLLSLPTLALTAAAAVLFESVPVLRRGLGNVIWFFLFGAVLSASLMSDGAAFDFSGFSMARESLLAAQQTAFPAQPSDIMSLSAGPARELRFFPWGGLEWTAGMVFSRASWLLVAVGLALLAVLPFDRFDPAGKKKGAKRSRRAAGGDEQMAAATWPRGTSRPFAGRVAGQLGVQFQTGSSKKDEVIRSFGRLLRAEIQLLVKGQAWIWWLGVGGVVVGLCVAPVDVVRRHLLPLAWIWPLLVLSDLGCRDQLLRTEALVDSASRPILRQLPAAWAAGALLVAAIGAPGLLRLLMAGEVQAAVAAATALVFVPSLALACGAWSGVPRLFEVGYLIIWYAGALNGVPLLDFSGTTDESIAAGTPLVFAASSAPLLALAALARYRRLRS